MLRRLFIRVFPALIDTFGPAAVMRLHRLAGRLGLRLPTPAFLHA